MALECVKKGNALAFHNSALLCRVLRCPKRRQRSECQGQESSSNAGRGVHRSVHQSAVHHGDGPGPVDVLDTAELSVACFNARYLTKNVPVVIQGHMNSWQGMKFHKSLPPTCAVEAGTACLAFLKALSERTTNTMTHVELGTAYTEAERVLVNAADYLDVLSRQSTQPGSLSSTVYLAQQPLFDQSQSSDLIRIPDYVNAGRGDMYSTNAWIGPSNTVSPLHRDPTHNLLAQLYGAKRVQLYANPSSKFDLYPHSDPSKANTSRVDTEQPDRRLFPDFPPRSAFVETVIYPGDILFIPRRMWHHHHDGDYLVVADSSKPWGLTSEGALI